MFVERLAYLRPVLPAYSPAPSIEDRGAWEGLSAEIAAPLLARGEAALGLAWPSLPARHYRAFVADGDRTRFETLYFERRRRLCALILAECVEDRGRFLDDVIDGMLLVCEESGWQLPAHNAYDRDGPRHSLPDPDRPVVDLFAAETGALLAVACAVLSHRLAAREPAMVARIDREIDRRILQPYLTRHFWWMGRGSEPVNNWTAWCTQNILLAAFARPADLFVRQRVLERAALSLDAFLKDYGEDGACVEGALYWRHAGLCLSGCLTVLAAVAPEAFAPLWGEPKIRAIAEFIADMHVREDAYFNFGDAAARLPACGVRELRFANAVGSSYLAGFAAWSAGTASAERPDEINLWYRLVEAHGADALAGAAAVPARRDAHYASIGLTIAHDSRFSLAVKGGHNGDSHNHNDVGSVTVWRDGSPVLIDLGVESYTAKTFSARRYEIWTMQSGWHNLPRFGEVDQQAGTGFAAMGHATRLDEDEVEVSMDIANAYPLEARLGSYRRRILFRKGGSVRIEDRWEGEIAPDLSLILACEPRIEADALKLKDGARIALKGHRPPRIETVPISDERLHAVWGPFVWRAIVPFAGADLRLDIT